MPGPEGVPGPGGGGVSTPRGMCLLPGGGYLIPVRCLFSGGVSAPGGCLLGGCLLQGVSAHGGCLLLGGGAWSRPPMATAVGGMHPTGMHSCWK